MYVYFKITAFGKQYEYLPLAVAVAKIEDGVAAAGLWKHRLHLHSLGLLRNSCACPSDGDPAQDIRLKRKKPNC